MEKVFPTSIEDYVSELRQFLMILDLAGIETKVEYSCGKPTLNDKPAVRVHINGFYAMFGLDDTCRTSIDTFLYTVSCHFTHRGGYLSKKTDANVTVFLYLERYKEEYNRARERE